MLGELLDHRYRVSQTLAKGGFGQTYIAEDQRRPGNPKCLVKHLLPASHEKDSLENSRRLFQAEAITLEKLGHHHQIPRLLAYFEEEGEFFLVQELIHGHPLSHELRTGKKWSEAHIIQLLHEVLNILVFVHDYGVIHRDIKPDNILRRDRDHKLVLVDFGSVKQLRGDFPGQKPEVHAMSHTIAIGTVGYMATEQSRGKPRPSSDLYSLGIIGIQAATGIKPTQLEEDVETGELIWQEWATDISPELATLLDKMVCYHFRDRYRTAIDALADLTQWLASRDPASCPNAAVDPVPPPESSSPESESSHSEETAPTTMALASDYEASNQPLSPTAISTLSATQGGSASAIQLELLDDTPEHHGDLSDTSPDIQADVTPPAETDQTDQSDAESASPSHALVISPASSLELAAAIPPTLAEVIDPTTSSALAHAAESTDLEISGIETLGLKASTIDKSDLKDSDLESSGQRAVATDKLATIIDAVILEEIPLPLPGRRRDRPRRSRKHWPKLAIAGVSLAILLPMARSWSTHQHHIKAAQNVLKTAETQRDQGQFEQCIAITEDIPSEYTKYPTLHHDVLALQDSCLLAYASDLAEKSEFGNAIAIAKRIPANRESFDDAQAFIEEWFQGILKVAETKYQNQEVEEAIRIAAAISADSPQFNSAQQILTQWQNELTQWNEAQDALAARNWSVAIERARAIEAINPNSSLKSQVDKLVERANAEMTKLQTPSSPSSSDSTTRSPQSPRRSGTSSGNGLRFENR